MRPLIETPATLAGIIADRYADLAIERDLRSEALTLLYRANVTIARLRDQRRQPRADVQPGTTIAGVNRTLPDIRHDAQYRAQVLAWLARNRRAAA